jgi:hypothetical protein
MGLDGVQSPWGGGGDIQPGGVIETMEKIIRHERSIGRAAPLIHARQPKESRASPMAGWRSDGILR